jgi:hypothetical protein
LNYLKKKKVIGLMVLLAASVASVVIKNGLGTCLSYTVSYGGMIITSPCNSSDAKQTNWVVTEVYSTSAIDGTAYTFCINGTILCSGIRKRPSNLFPHIWSGYYPMRLVMGNRYDPAQQWNPVANLPNNLVNGHTIGCVQAYSITGQGGFINTAKCKNITAQSWTVISS